MAPRNHRRSGGGGTAPAFPATTAACARALSIFLIAGQYFYGVASLNSNEQDDQCHPLAKLKSKLDNSWIDQLSPETAANREKSQRTTHEEDDGVSNTVSRPVYNGHYVPVKPTPLKNPRLVIHAPAVANILELSDDDVFSAAFLNFFSGDVDAAFNGISASDSDDGSETHLTWATPYALSIMGERYTSNCPFKTGDGYGDGRAISVGEVAVREEHAQHPAGARYELQIKGSGPTPFCRGSDGRAVLRSSVREFLASEAMAALGVSTTRALSLVVSDGPDGDTVDRPWYSDGNMRRAAPSMDDPRLARYSLQQRRKIVADWPLLSRSDPDVLVEEKCAMTTRVSPSFVRVGHFDLYARRVVGIQSGEDGNDHNVFDASSIEWMELEQMLWHACFREYPKECFGPYRESNDVPSAAKCLLEKSMDNLSTMTANWIRVGFTQGNFNADNCLVAGRTMDYGPFGFMDEYHPLFAKWTGSGDHFGFMNQPKAGYANFKVLVESVMPLIEAYDPARVEATTFHKSVLTKAETLFEEKTKQTFRLKLGFHPADTSADKLWEELEPLLRASRADWTLFWRQLYSTLKKFPLATEGGPSDYSSMLDYLIADDEVKEGSSPFYKPLENGTKEDFLHWITTWRSALSASSSISSQDTGYQNRTYDDQVNRMRQANPKYILREWMLVDAYTKASPPIFKSAVFPSVTDPSEGDDSIIHELMELVQHPYEEGTIDHDTKYFRRAPEEALNAGGTAFMS